MTVETIIVIPEGTRNLFEYWCRDCRQLWLWAKDHPFTGCGNCNSVNVVQGEPGSLNRKKLEEEHVNS